DLRLRSDESSARVLNAFLKLCGRTDTAHCAFSAGSAAATRAKYFTLLGRLRTDPQGAKVTYAEVVSATGSALEGPGGWPDLAKLLQQVWTTVQEGPLPAAGPFSLPALAPPPITASAASAPLQSVGQTSAIRCSESPNPGPAAFRSLDRFAYDGSGHTSGADPSVCVCRAEVAYLVHLRLLPRATVCQPDRVPFAPHFGQPLP